MTLIKDLIHIPERVFKGDFVLKLTEGVTRPDETLDSYVITKELVENFSAALDFIRSAIDSNSSKATYLDGSFGSGKSHFMAVLHLLLSGNQKARSIPELAAVVAKHADLMQGQRFLLVPYHMIGATSIESAVLGHYVEYISKLHPQAPIPGVYIAEHLFADARNMRDAMGDTAFFSRLNEARTVADSGWGDVDTNWDAARFDTALAAPPADERRTRLISDLVGTVLTAYASAMQGQKEAYVPIDQGLSIISQHARDLGYQSVVLFLDELILWLASHAANTDFVQGEIQKVSKLVESQRPDRPVPVISFVARQRDLRELIGTSVPGSEQFRFMDVLRWWESRLNKIGLLDRNLAAIAERRVLNPVSAAAKVQIDKAFDDLVKMRGEVLETLLTANADRDSFRQIYPFSPALVETLVALSSILQRERTAIKVMLQVLVNGRDNLKLGDVVPVGDLFDVIAEGDEAFSDVMRQRFEDAKRLYYHKLLPLLEAEQKLRLEDVRALSYDDPKAVAFRAHDRLAKTLILSALAPEVESFKNLTARKLAALNHGSIRSPIPGQEGQMVLALMRRWAASVGEIKVGEGANPVIAVQLSGVDTESIIEKAKVVDTPGSRIHKIREMLFREFTVANRDELFVTHEFLWRNTRRSCDVLFGNVRSFPDESLRAKEERWKLVIDYPFDDPGYTPYDDLAKLQTFRETSAASNTIVWIPSFFSRDAQGDLGTLVILDHILAGERFNDFASHLSAADRATARVLLDNRRTQLRERVRALVEAAYGIANAPPDALDSHHDLSEYVQSLNPTFHPQIPVGQNLGAALEHLLGQAFTHQFPDHPHFGSEVKLPSLRKVQAEVERAADDPQHRTLVDKSIRPLMREIAEPLKLGEMSETHFVLGDFWRKHFLRKKAQHSGSMTVVKMRAWTDEPNPRGLPSWVQNLLILSFADQENYGFRLHGGPPGNVALESLADELELEAVNLPAPDDWKEASDRVAALLGMNAPALLNATNASQLAEEIQRQVRVVRGDCEKLVNELRDRMAKVGVTPDGARRLQTALAVLGFVEAVVNAPPEKVVNTVAHVAIDTSATAMGTSLRRAGEICAGLAALNWEVFDGLTLLQDERAHDAAAIRKRVADAFAADEYASALMPILQTAQSDGLRLLTRIALPPPLPDKKPPVSGVVTGTRSNLTTKEAKSVFREIEAELGQAPDRRLDLQWTITRGGKKPS